MACKARLLLVCALLGLLWPAAVLPAAAQTSCQTASLPSNTVLGRLGAGQSGPCQAIPFANFFAQITSVASGATFASPVFTGTVSGAGTVPNSVLVNSSTTVNGVVCTLGSTCSITATAGTITNGVTLVASGTATRVLFDNAGTLGEYAITGTGNVAMSASPTFTGTAVFSHVTIESVTSTGATGTGSLVFATSPTFTTPTLGAATLTTANNVTITQPASSATLTIVNLKTLTVSKTLTLTGTDGVTITFPSTSGAMAALDIADQTLSGGANVTSANLGTKSSGTLTIDCGTSPLQYVTNGGAFTFAAPANDGSCIVLITNNASAGTVTFSGFTVGTTVGDALTTTNTNAFSVSVWRINSVSRYSVLAMQ